MIGFAVDVTAAAARARIPERIAEAIAAEPIPVLDAPSLPRQADGLADEDHPPEPAAALASRPPEQGG